MSHVSIYVLHTAMVASAVAANEEFRRRADSYRQI